MGLPQAIKYTIELPTVNDASSAFHVRESGYAQAGSDFTTYALNGLQTGILQSVIIPGTGLSLNMIKTELNISVSGKGWIKYEILWIEPVVTFTSNPVVENITDQIGQTPATARITLTGQSIPSPIYPTGTAVTIANRGQTVFRGWCTEVASSSSSGQTGTCVMTCYDLRWLWSGIYLGGDNPIDATDGYKADDISECIFNRNGLPNQKATGTYQFADGYITGAGAVMWTYGQAITALLTWYNSENLWSTDFSFINDLPHKDDIMPETNLTGQTLLSAVNSLIMAGQEISWRLDFNQNPVKIVAVTNAEPTVTLNYRTTSVSDNYATSCNVNENVTNGFYKVQALSSKLIMETHMYGSSWTKLSSNYDEYGYAFQLDAKALWTKAVDFGFDGTLPNTGDIPKATIVPRLVTRQNDTLGLGNFYAASDITDLLLSNSKTCREIQPWVWLSTDSGSTWKLLNSGYEIDQEKCIVFVGGQAQKSISTPFPLTNATVQYTDGTTENIVLHASTLQLAVTAAYQMDFRWYEEQNYAGFTWPFQSRVRVVRNDVIKFEGRTDTRVPDYSTAYSPPKDIYVTGEFYVDPTSKLTTIAAQAVDQNPGKQISVGVTAPYAPSAVPGNQLEVTNFSKFPSDTIYITQVTYNFIKGKLSMNITGSNQFWAENMRLVPDPNLAYQQARLTQDKYRYGYF